MESQLYLQEWLAGVAHNRSACGVAQTNQFVPAGRSSEVIGTGRRVWIDGGRKRNGDAGWPRQVRAIAQKSSSPGKRHRNYWRAGRHGGFESAKLERPHAIFSAEGAFRKNKYRLAVAQKFFHHLRLAQPGFRIRAVKLEVSHPF